MHWTFQIYFLMMKIKFSWHFQRNTSNMLWTSGLGFFFSWETSENKSHTHTHSYTRNPTTPHIYSCSHFDTHAYRVPHLNRCSGVFFSSIPLSCHPSPASNPSLRRLPSVDQRCKTIPPAPKLFLQPFISASLLPNWKHAEQRETLWGEENTLEKKSRQMNGKSGDVKKGKRRDYIVFKWW